MEEHNTIYEKACKIIKVLIKDIFILTIIYFLTLYKYPYVIYKPGGSIDLNGRIKIENAYDVTGSYNMNYVTVTRGNLPTILASFIVKNWDLKKEEEINISDYDYETTFKIEQYDMKNSHDIATMLAYQKAGKEIKILNQKGIILFVDKDANTNLSILDEIVSIDGHTYQNLNELKEYINSIEVGKKVIIKVKNDGKSEEKYAYIYEKDNQKLIGVSLIDSYNYETNPPIEIVSKKSEAGSSGGLMLTLSIFDKLTAKDYSHGKKIMGTGTIDITGKVGAIGGVKYKMLGANKDKADIFFVPSENYDEALETYQKNNFKFALVKVDTFDDAINYLNNLS